MSARVLLTVMLLAAPASLQQPTRDPAHLCPTARTCAECVRTPTCAWCASQNFSEKSELSRCRSTRNNGILDDWCDAKHLINPKSGKTIPIEDEDFASSDDGAAKTIQIKPQKVKLSLRVGEYSNLTVRFKRVRDRPIDVYYLLDMSTSLDSVKSSVARLTAEMRNFTSSLQLGFGSFFDKDILPFNESSPNEMTRNENVDYRQNSRIYSFKNQMALRKGVKSVQEAIDDFKGPMFKRVHKWPRGVLDGIVQAMVCEKEINWQRDAYRLLVVRTDNVYRIAGDGKLAGLVEPNDGHCHLDSDGKFTHSLLLDYPSLPQIKRVSGEKKINVIFVVSEESEEAYRVLDDFIDEVSVVLHRKSDNLASYITEEFKRISRTVKLLDNRADNVDIKYYTNCGNLEEIETNTCTLQDDGNEVNFTAIIKVTSCPVDEQGWKDLVIRPAGVDESLVVQMDVACGCQECENDPLLSQNDSPACSARGDLECGTCLCRDGFLGSRCECSSTNSSSEEDNPACKDADNKTCSGYGSCICSTCQCFTRTNPLQKYYGRLCECDNFSCKQHNGEVCGGNGECACGVCVCRPGWSGEACQCADNLDECRRPGDTVVCGGRGRCECGECMCDSTEDGHRYSGQYCEESPTGPGIKCKFFQRCAECEVNSNEDPDVCQNCSLLYRAVHLDDITDDRYDDSVDKICTVADENQCIFYYRYRFQDGSYQHWVQNEVSCSPDILGIIFGVIGFTFLAGLLIILLWKILTYVHDKREFAKFEADRAKAKWDQHGNPLFTPCTTTFSNPTFGKE